MNTEIMLLFYFYYVFANPSFNLNLVEAESALFSLDSATHPKQGEQHDHAEP